MSDPISRQIALKLCEEIRTKNQQKICLLESVKCSATSAGVLVRRNSKQEILKICVLLPLMTTVVVYK